jgi:putrescine transport system permease protein
MLRAIPFGWLLAFVAVPCLLLLVIAFAALAEGVPPFAWGSLSLEALITLTEDGFYLAAFLRSLRVAFITAALCLALAFPMALALARAPARWQPVLVLAVLLPFWTGFLLRMAAWVGLLRDQGWLNGVLLALGVIEEPLPLLYSSGAMLLGMVHAYLPFAVLPLYATLLRLDRGLEEAAADLGAGRFTVFRTITLPLAAPGAAAAFLLVFIPAAGEYVVPEMLGPPEAQLVGRAVWGAFFQDRDWPLACLLAVLLLAVLVLPIRLFQRLETRP